MNYYDLGDLIRCSAVFSDADGNEANPDTVTFKFMDPSNNTTTYVYSTDPELVNDAAGRYHVDVDIDETDLWWIRWESTGAGQAAGEGQFRVRESHFD